MISFRFTWWQVIIWIYKSTNSRTVNDFHLCECFANINCECDWKYCSGHLSSVHCFWIKKSVKGKSTTVKSLVVVTGYGSFCCTDHQSELPSQYIHRFCLTHFSLPRLIVLGHIVCWLNQNVESPGFSQVMNHRIRIQAFESLSCLRIFISKDISNLAKHNFCLC